MKRHFSRLKRRERLTALSFLALPYVGFVTFTAVPLAVALMYALVDYRPLRGQVSAPSFSVFLSLFTDKTVTLGFSQAVGNTLVMMLSIPITLVAGLAIAVVITQGYVRGGKVFRVLYYLPAVTGSVAILLVWKLMFNETQGIVNVVLKKLGLIGGNISWLGEASGTFFPRFTLILKNVWSGLGGVMILYVAGILTISQDYYEAAEIDGAGRVRKFFSITLPMLTPITFYHLVVSVIGGLQAFMDTQLLADTSGTKTIVYFIYEYGINNYRYGYASAAAFLLALVVMAVTIVQFRLSAKWVYSE